MVVKHRCIETGRSDSLAVGVDAVLVNGSQRLEVLDLCCGRVVSDADVEDASLFNFAFCFLWTRLKKQESF